MTCFLAISGIFPAIALLAGKAFGIVNITWMTALSPIFIVPVLLVITIFVILAITEFLEIF